LIGKYIKGSGESYEVLAKQTDIFKEGFSHLDLKKKYYQWMESLYGPDAADVWWEFINKPFLNSVADSNKVVYLTIDPKLIPTDSTLYKEYIYLLKDLGYSDAVKDSVTGFWKMLP
jgi:hypothetical protein